MPFDVEVGKDPQEPARRPPGRPTKDRECCGDECHSHQECAEEHANGEGEADLGDPGPRGEDEAGEADAMMMAGRTTPPRQAKTSLSYPAAVPHHCLELAKYRSITLRGL